MGRYKRTSIGLQGSKKNSRSPIASSKVLKKVLCIETSMYLGPLKKFEGAAGEFKGALDSQILLISSPALIINNDQINP